MVAEQASSRHLDRSSGVFGFEIRGLAQWGGRRSFGGGRGRVCAMIVSSGGFGLPHGGTLLRCTGGPDIRVL